MRLIDADELTNMVFEVCNKRNMTMTTEIVICAIRRMPTIVDVVRCKDCRNNYNTCTNHGINQPMCDFTDRMLKETDFCSRGERREKYENISRV